jgi:hypothetical protein
VGDEKIHNAELAGYFVRWIDRLEEMVSASPVWRSDAEKKHVFDQLDQAWTVYQRLRF